MPIQWGGAHVPQGPGKTVAQTGRPAPQGAQESETVAAPKDPASCRTDQDCGQGTYCEAGQCREVRFPTHYPPYLYYRSADSKFTEIMWIYWHRQGDSGYRVVFPLYWNFWTPEQNDTVFFPFYYRFASPKAGSRSYIVPPFQYRVTKTEKNYRLWPLLFWTDYGERGSGLTLFPLFHFSREGERRRALFIPLFYHSRTPERAFSWILPLNFHWRRGTAQSLLIFPLAYRHARIELSQQDGKHILRSRLFVAPFFYHQRDGDNTLFLGGPIYHRRAGQRTHSGLFPLFFYRHDRKAGEKMATLLPLFYYSSSHNYLRSKIISPLFLYERDAEAQVTQWGLVVPPIFSRRDSDREVDLLFPLFMRWRDKNEESTTVVVTPLIYNSDPAGGSQILFPIFWRFTDKRSGAATSILFPLAYRHKRPDGSHFNMLFPFYVGGGKHSWSAGIFPLLFTGAGEGEHHAVLFPLLWRIKNKQSATTVLGPIYHRRTPTGWNAGLAPLLFAGNDEGKSYQVLFPLLWHMRSHKEGYNTYVAGPAFYSKGKKGSLGGLLPLFVAGTWKGSSIRTVLPPLFYHSSNAKRGESSTLAALYYGYRKPGIRAHYLFPLFYYKQTPQRTTSALVPFYYHRAQGTRRLLITPLGGHLRDDKKRTSQGLYGIYGFKRSPQTRGWAILPLWFHWTRPAEKASTSILFPLALRHVSPERSAFILFPVAWRFTDAKERSLVLFPVYWQLHQKEGIKARVIFPLYWNIQGTKRHTRVVGPVFSTRTDEVTQAGIFPLAYYRRDKQGSVMGALPIIYYRNRFAAKEKTWVVGPYYQKSYAQGWGGGLFPLIFVKRTPERSYSILFPLLWDLAKPKEQKRTTVVGPIFYHRNAEDKGVGLLPVFHTSWDNAGKRTLSIFPLFHYVGSPSRKAFYTLLGGYDRSPARTQWHATIFFRRKSPRSTLNVLFPLAFYHRNHEEGVSRFFLPPYFGRWSREGSLHLLFPLIWHRRTVDSTWSVLFPLYWDFKNRFVDRTTMLFPLFLRHSNLEKKSAWFITHPFLWVRSKPEGNDAVLFPLFWRYKDKNRSMTVAAPLYWDFRRETKRATVFFPLFWRFENSSDRSYVVVNTYYRHSKKEDTYSFFFFPLVQVERRRPQDLNLEFLLGLVGYERIGKNRYFKLFDQRIPLSPTNAKTLSGFGGGRRVSWGPSL